MTTALSSSGARTRPLEPRAALAASDVRRGLTAMLRRRIPLQEVDDVAQTVLADALASPTVPTDPDELRRWLTGIARHKIADFHRRAARTHARMSDAEPAEWAASTPAAFEEREVLHALLGEERSVREAETIDWLLREHAGERLADIATERGVPAPVVRQRVSRLRRSLRSRWAGVIGLVALLAGLGALGLATSAPREAIAPEPAESALTPTAPASASPADVLAREAEGDWVIRAVKPNRALDAAEQRFVDVQARSAKIHVHGKGIEIEAPGYKTTMLVQRVDKTPRGARVAVKNEDGRTYTVDVVFRRDAAGPLLEVTVPGARFGGTVTLRRPIL